MAASRTAAEPDDGFSDGDDLDDEDSLDDSNLDDVGDDDSPHAMNSKQQLTRLFEDLNSQTGVFYIFDLASLLQSLHRRMGRTVSSRWGWAGDVDGRVVWFRHLARAMPLTSRRLNDNRIWNWAPSNSSALLCCFRSGTCGCTRNRIGKTLGT